MKFARKTDEMFLCLTGNAVKRLVCEGDPKGNDGVVSNHNPHVKQDDVELDVGLFNIKGCYILVKNQ